MPAVASSHSTAPTPAEAVAELITQLREAARGAPVAGGFLQATVRYDVVALSRALAEALPGVPFVGVTTCQGTATDRRRTDSGPALSALWLLGEDVRMQLATTREPERVGSGAMLARTASALSKPPGRQRFVVLHSTPGHEERLLEEVGPLIGDQVPLLGGSAADDDLSGKWAVFGPNGFAAGKGAVLAVVDWPGRAVVAMHSTALVTPTHGRVTRAEGRTVFEIDGQPAAEVYDRWLGGALAKSLGGGGSILADTTLTPLGVRRPGGGVGSHVLIHPEAVVSGSNAMTTFKAVTPGQEVFLMKATRAAFLGRPASVVERLLADARIKPGNLRGALLVYCAGCMLTVKDSTSLMLDGFKAAVGPVPFASGYFYGEQGCDVSGGKAEHGNLMTGVLLLSA
ncbi:MAG: FIST N-terminal domain-containing protein [Myxococcota bacterium]|jgi:hypothetical protein